MKKITKELIGEVSASAKESGRKRMNHNFHEKYSDPINRMINAVEPDAYFPPHKHESPAKREIFLILKGKVAVVEFDDAGGVLDHITLDAMRGNFGVEISSGVWHSIIPLEEGSVLYEIKDGPYDPSKDKIFPKWAPSEGDEGAKEFVDKVLSAFQV